MSAFRYTLRLAKEDFKFAAAHFTLFPGGRAELLHGHNYRVRVELAGDELGDCGLLFDLAEAKVAIRAACAELDERTLIPTASDRVAVGREGDNLEVRFDDRAYRFPLDDVALLPLENVSIELLAAFLWRALAPAFAGSPVASLAVEVEESSGQSCRYVARLDDAL